MAPGQVWQKAPRVTDASRMVVVGAYPSSVPLTQFNARILESAVSAPLQLSKCARRQVLVQPSARKGRSKSLRPFSPTHVNPTAIATCQPCIDGPKAPRGGLNPNRGFVDLSASRTKKVTAIAAHRNVPVELHFGRNSGGISDWRAQARSYAIGLSLPSVARF
jgi:hypothetical protein